MATKRARVSLDANEIALICEAIAKWHSRESDPRKRRQLYRLSGKIGGLRVVSVH